jgi:hypothetical protein
MRTTSSLIAAASLDERSPRPHALRLVDGIEVERGEHIAIRLRFPDWIEALALFMTESYVNQTVLAPGLIDVKKKLY